MKKYVVAVQLLEVMVDRGSVSESDCDVREHCDCVLVEETGDAERPMAQALYEHVVALAKARGEQLGQRVLEET